jgi:hypothetical protein
MKLVEDVVRRVELEDDYPPRVGTDDQVVCSREEGEFRK